MIVFIFFTLFGSLESNVRAAEGTSSQVGIRFTEKEEIEKPVTDEPPDLSSKEDTQGNSFGSGNRNESYNQKFPQTGVSSKTANLIGIICFGLGVYSLKRRGEKMKVRSKTAITSLIGIMSITGFATQAMAAIEPSVTEGSENGKGATSYGHIKLTQGDENTEPPILEPSEPGGSTGNKGPLTIDNVTPLLFSEHQLSGGKMIYKTISKNPNIQVTDSRGTGKGWALQVKSSEFIDQEDATKTLAGAEIHLPTGTLKTDDNNVSLIPEVKEIVLGTKDAEVQTMITAGEKAGLGSWVNTLDAEKVELVVPAGNLTGDYISTVNWSLLDAPA